MRDSDRDRGMTLTEMLITIAVVGIIMGALTSATVVFLRNQGSVSQRLDETRGLQQLVNFLPGDVASAQAITSDGPTACGSGGTPVLHLTWDEEFGDNVTRWSTTYRIFTGDQNVLTRFQCDGDTTTPSSQIDVVRSFSELQVNSATFSNGRVRMTINYPGSGSYPATRRTITAQSRNLTEGA